MPFPPKKFHGNRNLRSPLHSAPPGTNVPRCGSSPATDPFYVNAGCGVILRLYVPRRNPTGRRKPQGLLQRTSIIGASASMEQVFASLYLSHEVSFRSGPFHKVVRKPASACRTGTVRRHAPGTDVKDERGKRLTGHDGFRPPLCRRRQGQTAGRQSSGPCCVRCSPFPTGAKKGVPPWGHTSMPYRSQRNYQAR